MGGFLLYTRLMKKDKREVNLIDDTLCDSNGKPIRLNIGGYHPGNKPKTSRAIRQPRTKNKDLQLIAKYDDKGKLLNLNKPKRVKKPKYINMNTIVTFGRFKGKTGAEILKLRKSYLYYLMINHKCILCPQLLGALKK